MNHKQVFNVVGVVVAAGLIALVGVKLLTGSHALSYTTETARPANDFLNSEGINVHMASGLASADPKLAAAKIHTLGVRWVRSNTVASSAVSGDVILGQAGIKLDLPEDYDQYRAYGASLGTILRDTIKKNLLPYTFAVEGINEPDTSSFNQGANWEADSCAAQPQLYSAIKGDVATRHIIVMAPSITGQSITTRGPALLAACNLGNVADYANIHPYPGGWPPEYNNLILNRKAEAQQYEGTGAGKPVAFTETGYETGTVGSNHPISQAAEAVYMPRIYLQSFAAGIGLTAPYDLVDKVTNPPSQEEHFGMYNLDWSPKPAATAVSNMNAILADSLSKPAGSLQYAVSDATVKHMLLQKSDGSFYLALWREGKDGMVWDATSTDVSANRPLPGVTSNVTVSFPGAKNVATYMPNTSATPLQPMGSMASVDIPVGPKVVILKITAGTATPAPTTTVASTPLPTAPVSPTPTTAPSPAPSGLTGDINHDGHVTSADLAVLLSHWGQSVPSSTAGDLNNDGKVTAVDLALMLSNWGK